MKRRRHDRVLALHINARGYGFAIFDGVGTIVDFGLKHVTREDKNAGTLAMLKRQLTRFQPDIVVIEDHRDSRSLRRYRARKLYRRIEHLTGNSRAELCCYDWQSVAKVFGQAPHRHAIATIIASSYPVLHRRLPPKRKLWQPMDLRQSMFDAVALAVAHYAIQKPQA